MAAADLNQPTIPLLINNTIDPESLNGGPLDTYAKYPNPLVGDTLHQSWLGLAEDGTAVDVKAEIGVDPDSEGPDGFLMPVGNEFVLRLDKGQVFYSYFLQRNGEPPPGEESKRIHFGIGKHGLSSAPQIKESHNLQLDYSAIVGTFTIAVVPYGVMSNGDVVRLIWKGVRSTGLPGPVYNPPAKTLSDTDTDPTNNPRGVLTWAIAKSQLTPLNGGSLTLHYEITYANPASQADLQSAERTFSITKPPATELPAPAVKDLTGDVINPGQFPNGIRVVVPPYPGIRVGDEILVYGTRLEPGAGILKNTAQYLKIDSSHIGSGRIEVPIPAQWLLDNRGGKVSLRYQYARPDAAGSSLLLELSIRESRQLPPPTVDGSVTLEGRDELNPILAISGANVTIPSDATIGEDEPVKAHWEGFGVDGSHIADTPSQAKPLKFKIPSEAVPPNFSKTVEVRYEVDGEFSLPLSLYIRPLAGHPGLVCEKAEIGSPVTLKRSDVPETGLVVSVDRWSFISTRQQVRVWLSSIGIEDRELLPVRNVLAEEVTGGVKTRLLRTHLAGIATNTSFTLRASASFDGGNSTVIFNKPLSIKLLD